MIKKENHKQNEPDHKRRTQDGFTPGYKAFNEVYITKDLGSKRNDELKAFIKNHITEFKGKAEEKHGIPQMFFERNQDAQEFAKELSTRLDIQKGHVTVKARKFTR